MKRVLIISADFPPQGGTGTIRIAKFVKYLPHWGWQPVVVCSDTTWNSDESLARDIPRDVPVYRVSFPRFVRALRPSIPARIDRQSETQEPKTGLSLKMVLARVARRLLVPDAYVLWAHAAEQTCERVLNEHPCDAMLTTSPPHSIHLVGEHLNGRFNLPWVADFRDVWTAENIALQAQGEWYFERQRHVERRLLHACDRAIMITEPLRQCTIRAFGAHLAGKLITISNGFDPEDFLGHNPPLDSDVITINYVGTVLGPQVANVFPAGLRLALARDAEFRQKVRVQFVGQLDRSYRAQLVGLEANVAIMEFVSHRAAVDLMRRAHVLLMLLPNTNLARMTFGNKFFEYLAARRPILALVPQGVISEIITGERIGMIAPPDDPPAIAQALLAMFRAVRARPNDYQADKALLARYERRELTRQLVTVLENVSG